ncbi:MAG TPA: hypothetical protein VF733_01785, partial [Candidatus Saccharimonadales bacterium]
ILWLLLQRFVPYEIRINTFFPPTNLPAIGIILGGLVVLRGVWATLLLRTSRSPKERGLRIFYVVLAAAWLIFVTAMNRYAYGIFTPNAYNALSDWGLIGHNLAMSAYALLSIGLLFTAGIDRSLYKDTRFSRAVRRGLAPSQPK